MFRISTRCLQIFFTVRGIKVSAWPQYFPPPPQILSCHLVRSLLQFLPLWKSFLIMNYLSGIPKLKPAPKDPYMRIVSSVTPSRRLVQRRSKVPKLYSVDPMYLKSHSFWQFSGDLFIYAWHAWFTIVHFKPLAEQDKDILAFLSKSWKFKILFPLFKWLAELKED